MVTHDQAIAAQADRTVRLVEGRVERGDGPRTAGRGCATARDTFAPVATDPRIRVARHVVSRSTSTANCTTKKTPRSASTTTGCSTATACSKACAVYGGKVFRMQEHLERLWNSAKAIWLEIPMTREALAQAVNETAAGQRHRGRLRPAGGHARRRHAGPGSQPDAAIRR